MIPLFKVKMNDSVPDALKETLLSGTITEGPKVELFENKLREIFRYEHLITVNSATSALTLAIRMIKDEILATEECEVLTSPLTCMATNEPILANNLHIKWVDVDPLTCNIDLLDLEKKISRTTKILIFVHWGGSPLDLDKLEELLDRKEKEFGYRIKVIQDCAHAFLAEWSSHKLGTQYGHYAVYSFQAIKHLTTGDGGALLCPTKEKMDEAKLLRWFGIDRNKRNYNRIDLRLENDVVKWGYKFHMNDINATIGIQNIETVDKLVGKHRTNAAYYNVHLKNIRGLKLLDNDAKGVSSYWIYTLLIEKRDEFIKFMSEKKITVSCVHKRNDKHTCFNRYKTELLQLDNIEKEYVCIPVGWWLEEHDLEYIVRCIREFSNLFL